MSVGTWNPNSWSAKENENSRFREAVLQNLDMDVLCENETFLVKDDELKVLNFRWFGRNRQCIATKKLSVFGGVGMSV